MKSDLDFRATFVGDGPLLNRFREVTKDDIRFYFTGHLDSSELESVYLENEILVLPSFSEPWGLVVNEAINFGLAVLVSENVGCHPELVQKNGEVFSPYSEDNFLNALIKIINNLDMHRHESLFLAEKYTFLNQAKQFVEAVQGD
ncbi:glycosyltransferase family 4 protein [Photobacterium leiognathi subsp. mandapamensis]